MGKKMKIVRSSITQSASQSVKVDFHCRVIFTCSEVVAILVYRTKHERIKFFLYVPPHFFVSSNQHGCWSWEWKGLLQAKGHLFAYLIAFSDLVVEPVHPHLPRPLRRLTTKSLLALYYNKKKSDYVLITITGRNVLNTENFDLPEARTATRSSRQALFQGTLSPLPRELRHFFKMFLA